MTHRGDDSAIVARCQNSLGPRDPSRSLPNHLDLISTPSVSSDDASGLVPAQ
jgi:hypothetical protein